MKWRDRLRDYGLIGASAVIFLFAPVVALQVGWNIQTAIYWVTALVVLHYTFETYRMRQELVRQNQLAVQPLVLATVERVDVAPGKRESLVVLRNIGRGPALFVHADDFNIHDDEAGGGYSLRIPTVDCIEGGKEAFRSVELIGREVTGTERVRDRGFVATLDPKYAADAQVVILRYEDINRGRHWAKTQMGKGGIRLLEHGRE
jgi:hypothetical protein